jgi:hypothetical protein
VGERDKVPYRVFRVAVWEEEDHGVVVPEDSVEIVPDWRPSTWTTMLRTSIEVPLRMS